MRSAGLVTVITTAVILVLAVEILAPLGVSETVAINGESVQLVTDSQYCFQGANWTLTYDLDSQSGVYTSQKITAGPVTTRNGIPIFIVFASGIVLFPDHLIVKGVVMDSGVVEVKYETSGFYITTPNSSEARMNEPYLFKEDFFRISSKNLVDRVIVRGSAVSQAETDFKEYIWVITDRGAVAFLKSMSQCTGSLSGSGTTTWNAELGYTQTPLGNEGLVQLDNFSVTGSIIQITPTDITALVLPVPSVITEKGVNEITPWIFAITSILVAVFGYQVVTKHLRNRGGTLPLHRGILWRSL